MSLKYITRVQKNITPIAVSISTYFAGTGRWGRVNKYLLSVNYNESEGISRNLSFSPIPKLRIRNDGACANRHFKYRNEG